MGCTVAARVMSIPHSVFPMMERYPCWWVPWWPPAWREVRAMSVAVMGIYSDLGAPVACTPLGSDARGPAADRPPPA